MKLLPRLFLAFSFAVLFLCLSLPALAAPKLRGDWESSGAPPVPYKPKYGYAYNCQVQMTDRNLYTFEGRESVVYAVAEFQLNNQKNHMGAKEMNWVLARFSEEETEDGDLKTEVLSSEIPFSVEGTFVNLMLSPASSKKHADSVSISLDAAIKFSLPTGDEFVSRRGRDNFNRNDTIVATKTSISSSARAPASGRSINAAVYCEKQK